ncbi:3-hydroxyisobutyrate dehydrogenase [Nesterenkonia sp. E16_7]|uniref:3-hydroxyisobutyrate dehydrogenase n=1 Tax=unclassified Nesterenkonia TaxID=2629769 RepID=UPI001A91CAC7|nr:MULTISPECIES: 3-hydroxyisobutyrate dehydrogenase [unclassified Nesterenkonia]MBO0594749.1 3-hydroxyisobutyrate dehydrogenase [Nesterenkonia sp. E16_10]MBO0597777.1 3-hydroxyisobutyrate dehydrogenase [Nesterenkonia sp. E16_7]
MTSTTGGTPAHPSVAFIGLGNMGGPMAANLVQAGVAVAGFDLSADAVAVARSNGIETVTDPLEAVATSDVVLTMLPSGKHVLSAYQDSPGLLSAARPGTIFLDCSTINISEAQQAAELAERAGFRAADAPVSGGVVGAEAGSLAFMAGGRPEVFEEIRPLLEIMGARVVHCGGSGLGQAAKVCNNMILGVSQIAVAEAFVLGERLGLDHQALYDVVSHASGQCWALTTNCPVPGPVPSSPANRDFTPGFAGALMAKDLTLATNALQEQGVDAQLGRLAAAIFTEFAQGPGARQDFSGIINTIRDNSHHPGA